MAHISFEKELPEGLTAEKYLKIFKKIWEVVRYELYLAIQAKSKENTRVDLYSLYDGIFLNFEKIRT